MPSTSPARLSASRVALSACLTLAMSGPLTGCSWILMERAPSTPERLCSDSATIPALDGLLAVGNILAGANIGDQAVLFGVLWAVIHGASAITGIGWAEECAASRKDDAKSAGARTGPFLPVGGPVQQY